MNSVPEAFSQARLQTFAEATDSNRTAIHLIALSDVGGASRDRELRELGVRKHILGARSPGDLKRFVRLHRLLRNEGFDVLHAHSAWASAWGGRCARLGGPPLIATLYRSALDEDDRAKAKLEERAIRALNRWSRRVVAVSESQWDRYVRAKTFSRALLEVVHPGMDTSHLLEPNRSDRLALRKQAGFSPDAVVAVTLASFQDHENGLDQILWAMPAILAEVPEIRFVIVGTGESREEFKRRLRVRGLNRFVHWRDDVGESRKNLLAGADLCIQPRSAEAFPFGLLEGMSGGLPVVATLSGGAPEVLGSGNTGRLVPPTDPDALAQTVVALAQEPETLVRMGLNGQERVRTQFSSGRWVREMEDLYRKVIQEEQTGVHRARHPHAGLDVKLLGRKAPPVVAGPSRA